VKTLIGCLQTEALTEIRRPEPSAKFYAQ
jgi:hypothetical protein